MRDSEFNGYKKLCVFWLEVKFRIGLDTMGDSELVRTLESAQGISLGGSVSDSAVVIATTSLAVVIGLLVVLVWRRSWDRSGDNEVKPVVVPKLSEWSIATRKRGAEMAIEERGAVMCRERERGRTDAQEERGFFYE